MLVAIEQLVKGERTNVGNHSCKEDENGCVYYYHQNPVCVVDYKTQTFKLNDCGWGGHQSTIRTLNDYRRWFNEHCFTEVFTSKTDMVDFLAKLSEGRSYRFFFGSTDVQVTCTKRVVPFGNGFKKTAYIEYVKVGEKPESSTFMYKGTKTFKDALKSVIETPGIQQYFVEQ